MLQVELQRGDLPTDASVYISSLSEIEGAQYFFEALERMGKEPFAKGYGSGTSKRATFSHILEVSAPSATDTFADFKETLGRGEAQQAAPCGSGLLCPSLDSVDRGLPQNQELP